VNVILREFIRSIMTKFSEVIHTTLTVETTTTMIDGSGPSTNVTRTAMNCSDPEQRCYYAHILRVVEALDLYLLPLISVVGCVGNVLSFLVFTTTYLRRLSSSVYLAALAVVDTIFLLVLFCSSLSAFGIQVRHCNSATASVVRKLAHYELWPVIG